MGVDTKLLLRGNVSIFDIAVFIEAQKIVRPDVEILRGDPSRAKQLNITLTHMPPDEFVHLNFGWMSDETIKRLEVPNGFIRWDDDDIEHRHIAVFWKISDSQEITKGEDFTHVSMGMWGSSVQIAELLGRKFGGFIMRNDSTDDWEPIEKVEEVS